MKRFLVIVLLTAAVWLGVSISEEGEYPLQVRVQMVGYDTVRYALLQSDTVLPLQVRMTGFDALLYSLKSKEPTLEVPVHGEYTAVAVSNLDARLKQVIPAGQSFSSDEDSIHAILAPRSSRAYVPRIDQVNFSFEDQYGLYGEPQIKPSEVLLYGPEEVLAQINELRAMPANLSNIKESGTYKLFLEPVWENYPDVRPSCHSVDIYLPVEPYVEKTFEVPVVVEGIDSTVEVKLYPEKATVRVWLAQRDLQHDPQMKVTIQYDEVLKHEGRATPHLDDFPAYVRPRSVEPQVIQCVVLQ